MSTETRIEKIRDEISQSKLLSDHEKADWLNLLELMNDKQLTELEDILQVPPQGTPGPTIIEDAKQAVPKPVPVQQPVQATPTPPPASPKPAAPAAPVMPQLSHLANMPTQVSYAKPEPFKPAPISKAIAPKQLGGRGAPAAKPIIPRSSPVFVPQAPAGRVANLSQPLKDSMAKAAATPKPKLEPEPTPHPKPNLGAGKPLLEIKNLDDVAALDLTKVRTTDSSGLMESFLELTKMYGYFAVLRAFESSKLYKSYLTKGKSVLAGESTEGKFTVSQEEFEMIADLLQAIRINRV